MEELLKKYDVKRIIHEAVKHDSWAGVAHIYIDTGASSSDRELPLILDPRSIKKGSLRGFKVIDPTWMYPAFYNATDPFDDTFYKPQQWFVMGQVVHESRFLDMVSRPVPDILKPSYNFGGMSLTQLMIPFVDDYRDVKYNVTRIIKTLRMRALATDMDARLESPGEFDKRMKLFSMTQENFGIWAIDKGSEDIIHTQTSLGELSNLMSSYQEQMCMPARVTNLKYLGNAPAGLNASGESEIETWHETVSGYQDANVRHPLDVMIKIIQMSEFGEVDDDISFEFKPLDEMSDELKATINKTKVETVAIAVESQVISTEEAREAISAIEGAGMEGLSENDFDGSDYDEEDDDEEEEPQTFSN